MNADPVPLRELPPGRLADRGRHLRAELAPVRRRRLRLAALAGAAVCAAASAAALALTFTGGSGGAARMVYGVVTLSDVVAAPAPTTRIAGGTPAQRGLLRSIVRAMRPNAIASIGVRNADGLVTLRMIGPDTSMRTLWEKSLVAAAFRDRSGATVAVENGESSGVISSGPAVALPAAKPGAVAAARRRFEAAAAKIGVQLGRLTVYRPDGIAIAATLRSGRPAWFLVHRMPAFLGALGDRGREYDGTYIRLVDAAGRTVWETSTDGRTWTGSVGSRPDLAGCSPVADFGPTPPRCPVR